MSAADPPVVWALRLSARARADIAAARAFLLDTAGKRVADAWEQGLEEAIASLATFPERGALAEETILFPPPPLRDIVYRRRSRGPGHRIFYRLYENPVMRRLYHESQERDRTRPFREE